MNLTTAKREAKAEAIKHNIVMVVTYNPYDEAENEADRYGYMPEHMFQIIEPHENKVETIEP